ncbi:MAG: hypothetical protein NW217_08545 [Hyphomicrobiaceae bacterium]|nr:hypothetical protein [Hyphomicrobiaceae bacterium]
MTTKNRAAACLAPWVASALLLTIPSNSQSTAHAAVAGAPFAALHGWWSGEGRLGFREGKVEAVKCRVTYRPGGTPDALAQAIRCATPSGKVEITSNLTHADGKLTGDWTEQVHNLSGKLDGEVTANGFRVTVASDQLKARMEIIVRDGRQVIEIQFDTSLLVGMTLLLQKGSAS